MTNNLHPEARRMAWHLAAEAEMHPTWHGKRSEWYRMWLYLPGTANNMHIPYKVAKGLLQELLDKIPDGIVQIPWNQLPDWICVDLRLDNLIDKELADEKVESNN